MTPLEQRILEILQKWFYDALTKRVSSEELASSLASLMEEEMKGVLKWYLESSYVVISSPHQEPIFINSETSSGERYNLNTLVSLYLLSLQGKEEEK